MVWRVLGVAVVLLGVGVVGGYAVAQRSSEQPVVAGDPTPVVAVSPAVPTPPTVTIEPDPGDPALLAGVLLQPDTLRTSKRDGFTLEVSVPSGWVKRRQSGSDVWNYVPPPGTQKYTYKLRVGIVYGDHESLNIARNARIAALEEADQNNADLAQFQVTDMTDDGYEATYIESGHERFTAESWALTPTGTAYAVASVTGRLEDTAGATDLLDRVIASMADGDAG